MKNMHTSGVYFAVLFVIFAGVLADDGEDPSPSNLSADVPKAIIENLPPDGFRPWAKPKKDDPDQFMINKMVSTRQLPAMCTYPIDAGNICSGVSFAATHIRYGYNTRDKSCVSFSYRGCDGNSNNFDTFAECKKTCEVNDVNDIQPSRREAPSLRLLFGLSLTLSS